MDILKALPKGKERAISAKQLAVICGYSDVRSLQNDIHSLRARGAVILSTTQSDNPGYYLPSEGFAGTYEVEQYYHSMNNRAAATRKAAESAKRYLDKATGQISLDGC